MKKENKPLTKKQRKLVKAIVKNGGNKTRAALEVYNTKKPANAQKIASKALKQPNVQTALEQELKAQGVTLANAIAPISKGLLAKMRNLTGDIMFDKYGQTIDDLDKQLKASDRALKLLLPKEKTDSLNLNFHIDADRFGGEFVEVVEGEINEQ